MALSAYARRVEREIRGDMAVSTLLVVSVLATVQCLKQTVQRELRGVGHEALCALAMW